MQHSNAKKCGTNTSSASVTCNASIVASNSEIFPNGKTSLDDGAIQNNISKIREVIANNQGINIKMSTYRV